MEKFSHILNSSTSGLSFQLQELPGSS